MEKAFIDKIIVLYLFFFIIITLSLIISFVLRLVQGSLTGHVCVTLGPGQPLSYHEYFIHLTLF